MGILNYQNIPILVSLLFFVISTTTFFLIRRVKMNKNKVTKAFLEQLKFASGKEVDFENIEEANRNIIQKMYYGFAKNIIDSEIVPKKYSEKQVANATLLLFAFVYAIFFIMFNNFGIGIVPIAIIIALIKTITDKKIKNRKNLFAEQLPSFLSLLKSNIQAGETPERALINAIEETASPLYDEIKIAQALTQTGSFQNAISTLRKQTEDDTLKFLCGCIEIAVSVGANLEEQIVTIETMLEAKNDQRRKLNVAANSSRPLLYVGAATTPLMFLFQYISDEGARAYWFNSLGSWIVFGVACTLYGAGLFLTNRLIVNTGKF